MGELSGAIGSRGAGEGDAGWGGTVKQTFFAWCAGQVAYRLAMEKTSAGYGFGARPVAIALGLSHVGGAVSRR